nr:hypothetical protein [Tanacetum cinerariifolium]
MTFGGNTRDFGLFGEETGKIMDLHQIHEEVLFTESGEGVAGIKLRRRDLSSDGVRDLVTASGRGQLKDDLDENPIRTLGDYSKPSHEGYRNTIELSVRNNVRGGKILSKKTDVTIGDDIEKLTKTEMEMPIKSTSQKIKGKTYNLSPRGLVYEAILRKKITRKEDIRENFEIPCKIEGLKHMNALVNRGSNINVMPLSTYMKLTDERPAETDIRLSLASHSYIYPLGIPEDVIIKVAKYVYPVDFMISDIKEDEKRPFILETPFLTTAKAIIKFDKGTITLRSGKSKISFHKIPESLCKIKRGVKNDIEPISPTMTVNRLVVEWEKRIKLHLEREMEFDQWKRKNFKGKHPAFDKVEGEMDDEGEVTKFLIKNEEEFLTMPGDDVRIKPDGVASPAM